VDGVEAAPAHGGVAACGRVGSSGGHERGATRRWCAGHVERVGGAASRARPRARDELGRRRGGAARMSALVDRNMSVRARDAHRARQAEGRHARVGAV
jgi:hypothetical protein